LTAVSPPIERKRVMACPDCAYVRADLGRTGIPRIGNRRSTCVTCNRFVQKVRRRLTSRLLEEFPEEAARLRLEVEERTYREFVATFDDRQSRALEAWRTVMRDPR
jgi:hypothetical protein